MLVGAVGYNYRHKKDFLMDCPDGAGCPLILLIKEPSVFVINGKEQKAEKNSFLLLSPDTPVSYHAAEEYYTDDWLYFNYEQGDREKIRPTGHTTGYHSLPWKHRRAEPNNAVSGV